jgi:hypothetical protein
MALSHKADALVDCGALLAGGNMGCVGLYISQSVHHGSDTTHMLPSAAWGMYGMGLFFLLTNHTVKRLVPCWPAFTVVNACLQLAQLCINNHMDLSELLRTV